MFIGCSVSTETSEPKSSQITILDQHFQGQVQITKTSKGFKLSLTHPEGDLSDRAIFNYPWYKLDTADVNHDGRTEILVGVIKTAEFDPKENRRLFIIRIDDGELRPLWLGSKVCQQLVDFRSLPDGIIKTLEKTPEGHYAVGIYEWQSFGLSLIRYIDNNKPYGEALTIFNI